MKYEQLVQILGQYPDGQNYYSLLRGPETEV